MATIKAPESVKNVVKKTTDRAKSLRERASKRLRGVAEDTRDITRRKSAQFAVSVVEFQKTTMGHAIDLIGKVQDSTGKALHNYVGKASWVPGEGREVVDEWNRTIKKGREDFRKTSDKSFDLILKYLDRVQKQTASPKKKAGAKKATAKKVTAKKAAPKKAAAKKKASSSTPAAPAPGMSGS